MEWSGWARWKRVARRAAELQAGVLFMILYAAGILPLRAFGVGREILLSSAATRTEPGWTRRRPQPCDLSWARRQF